MTIVTVTRPRRCGPFDEEMTMANPDQNLATACRWLLEVFNNRDFDAIPEIIADMYVNHGTTTLRGPAAGRAVITQANGYTPDRRIEIISEVAQDNIMFMLFRVTGTQTGPFMGVPPSGRSFSVDLVDLFYFDEADKMIEGWVVGTGDIKLALEALHAT
jgi:predicted ester cyclase